MNYDKEHWNQLDSRDQKIASLAALIPPPISLDFWAKAASLPSVKVLQLAEKLVRAKIMRVYEPLGVGYYHFGNPTTVETIVRWNGPVKIAGYARRLIPLFESEYADGPKRWMAMAYVYQTAHIPPLDPGVLIQAAQYCLNANLRNDAAQYYQLVIAAISKGARSAGTITAYTDAAIGLCLNKGKSIALQEQQEILSTALSFSKRINDPERTTMVLVQLGQVYKSLGNYTQAADMFEKGWDKASRFGSAELVKRVAFATTDFLMWQGRLSEAIERYENVLGNLDELPSDEPSLQACAQLGWIYGKCGQTVRGIGLINSVMEKAVELGLDYIKVYSKVATINCLHDARRNAEAEPIIDEVLAIAPAKLDDYILWPLYAAKAYVHSYRREYEACFRMQELAYASAKFLGHFHHRGPINFDYMDILEDAGFVHPEMNYESEIHRVIHWPDTYMQGVGYYYRAKRTIKRKGSFKEARTDLSKSLDLLDRSGARLDLAFTQILLARLLIESGDRDSAEALFKEAWGVLRFVNDKLFPQEFKHIVLPQSHDGFLLDPFVEISETIGTIRSRRKLLNHIITLTLQLTGAERGAFFVPLNDNGIEMIASRNIEPELFQTEAFSGAMAAIERVMDTGEEIVRSNNPGKASNNTSHNSSGWQIAYPVKLQGKILGSFFMERNLSGFAVSERILSLLKAISTQVAVALDNVRAYEEIAELKDQLEAETLFYRSEPSNARQAKDIVGDSANIKEVIARVCDVAHSDTTVLIIGETGVGKELVAKAIHQLSNRSSGPFIPVSIASLSDSLIPSELFGHEKGAFTNALRTHRGRFELANKGTLFLDEVNSLSLDIQSKLLRVLEEKAFERVGGSAVIRPNFRLIAASNQPLDDAVKNETFRSDLFYRLNVYPITVPPLRERKEDIALLVAYFVRTFNQKFGKNYRNINKRSMQHLMDYPWPGNVRELKHAVERAVISCKDKQLSFPDFCLCEPAGDEETHFLPLKEMERQYIMKALARCQWKVSGQSGAAKLLGLNPQTLYSKIKRLGIQKKVSMEISVDIK